MKKELILPVIVLVLSLAAILTLAILKARMPVPILLIRESGQVSYKTPGSTEFIKVTEDETEIQTGTSVKTEEGLAHVLLPDNSLISIDSKTEIVVNYAPGFVDIVQLVGRTWHRVVNLGSGKYQVNTPTALATVRGTVFGVNANGETGLYVIESNVDIQQKLENDQLGEVQNIREGKHAAVKKFLERRGVDLGDMSDDQKNSPWFKRNRELDENFRNKVREEFRRKILEKVRERKSFELRLRLEGAVTGDITLNEVACQDPSRVVNFLNDRISQRPLTTANREALTNFRNKFVESCNDGVISPQEIDALKGILEKIAPPQTPKPTSIQPSVTQTETPTPTTTRITKPTSTPTSTQQPIQ